MAGERDGFPVFFSGLGGVLTGYVKAGLMVGGAALLNVVHNVLPVFFFVFPLLIMALVVLAPTAFCASVGDSVARTGLDRGFERRGLVSLFAVLWAGAGVMAFLLAANLFMADGQSFLADGVVPFFRMMVGAAIHFEWAVAPEPADISSRTVYWVFGVTTALGLLSALGSGGLEEEDLDD